MFAHLAPDHSGAMNGTSPSASSRIRQLGKEVQTLKEAASGVLKNLRPDAPVPGSPHDLATRLDGASAAIDK